MLIIEKNKVTKNKLLNIICGIIIENHNCDIHDVLIVNNCEHYIIKENNIVRVSSQLFKYVNDNKWELKKNKQREVQR